MLIPRLYDSIQNQVPITIQGIRGLNINPIHVREASKAVLKAVTINQSAIFNIAGPEILSIREISEMMGTYLHKEPIFNFIDSFCLVGVFIFFVFVFLSQEELISYSYSFSINFFCSSSL